jgi:L-fucose mutarotase/ribose pyranase (RbsD/FucU family)
MVQYTTLRDYRFTGDVDDFRGSHLYGVGGKKIARIRDIVFDNNTGDLRYLVADCGYGRKVLIPLEQVSYAAPRHAFFSELSSDDLVQLPAFTERVLENDEQWRDFEQLYRGVLEEQHPESRRTRVINRGAKSAFAQRLRQDLRRVREADSDPKRRIA